MAVAVDATLPEDSGVVMADLAEDTGVTLANMAEGAGVTFVSLVTLMAVALEDMAVLVPIVKSLDLVTAPWKDAEILASRSSYIIQQEIKSKHSTSHRQHALNNDCKICIRNLSSIPHV